MKEVAFFEDSCSRPSDAAPLVEYLRQRFEGEVEVRTYDVGRAETRVPAMTIDGAVYTEGWLPSLEDAAAFVNAG
jgi:hypothetical protein